MTLQQQITALAQAVGADIRQLDPSRYPSIRPSLSLDFTNNRRLDPRVTFTRASGAGRFNAQGQYEWLPANQPRIDYDPFTGEAKGLLIEEQRTNLLTYSSDFANAVWGKVDAVVTPNAIGPDGATTASKLSEGTVQTVHLISRTYGAATVGVVYTSSLFAKAAERTSVYLRFEMDSGYYGAKFDLTNGSASEASAGITAHSVYVGNGWYRCSITRAAATTAPVRIYNYVSQVGSYQGDGTSGIYIWGAQLEAGSFPTSYIPATTAQVTRAADVASVNVLSPWFNASEGALFVEASTFDTRASAFPCIASLYSDANNYIAINHSNANTLRAEIRSAGSLQALLGAPVVIGAANRLAMTYAENSASAAVNGGSPVTDSAVIVPAMSALSLGRGPSGTLILNGHICALRFYPKRLSNAELQELTA